MCSTTYFGLYKSKWSGDARALLARAPSPTVGSEPLVYFYRIFKGSSRVFYGNYGLTRVVHDFEYRAFEKGI